MDELEIERQTLQLTAEQARINPNHTEIEDFLKDDSELADEKRHLSLPEAHVAEGAQVHHQKCRFSTTCIICLEMSTSPLRPRESI